MKSKDKQKASLRTAASILDSLSFSALIVIVFYLSGVFHKNKPIFIVIYVLMVIIVRFFKSKYSKIRDERIQTERTFRENALRLMLLSDGEIRQRMNDNGIRIIRNMHPNEADIISAIRSGAHVIGSIETTEEMKEVVRASGKEIKFLDFQTILNKTGIADVASKKYEPKQNREDELIRPNLKYYILACLLFALSFFVRLKIYYRLAAFACMFFAAVIGIWGRVGKGKTFHDFLDKKGR